MVLRLGATRYVPHLTVQKPPANRTPGTWGSILQARQQPRAVLGEGRPAVRNLRKLAISAVAIRGFADWRPLGSPDRGNRRGGEFTPPEMRLDSARSVGLSGLLLPSSNDMQKFTRSRTCLGCIEADGRLYPVHQGNHINVLVPTAPGQQESGTFLSNSNLAPLPYLPCRGDALCPRGPQF